MAEEQEVKQSIIDIFREEWSRNLLGTDEEKEKALTKKAGKLLMSLIDLLKESDAEYTEEQRLTEAKHIVDNVSVDENGLIAFDDAGFRAAGGETALFETTDVSNLTAAMQSKSGKPRKEKEDKTSFKTKLENALAKAFGYEDGKSVPDAKTPEGRAFISVVEQALVDKLSITEAVQTGQAEFNTAYEAETAIIREKEAVQEVKNKNIAGREYLRGAVADIHRGLTELEIFSGARGHDDTQPDAQNTAKLTEKQKAAIKAVAADAFSIAGGNAVKDEFEAWHAIEEAIRSALDIRSSKVQYELLSDEQKAVFRNIRRPDGSDNWVLRPRNQVQQAVAEYQNLRIKQSLANPVDDAGNPLEEFQIFFTDADAERMAILGSQLGLTVTVSDEDRDAILSKFVPTTAEELFGKGWDKRPGLDPEWNQTLLDEHNEKRRQEFLDAGIEKRRLTQISFGKVADAPTSVRPPGGYVPGQMYPFPASKDILLTPDPETGEARYASGRPGYFGIPVTDFTKRDPFKRPASEEEAAVSYEVVPTRGETQSMIDRRIPSALTQFQKQAGETSPLGTAEAQRIQSALPNLRREYDKRVQEIAQQTGSAFDPRGVYDKRFIPTIGAMGEPGTPGYREQRPAYDTFQDFLKKRRKTGQFQAPQQAAAASGTSSAIPFGRSLLRTRFG